jgi:hypothetical protein
MVSGEVNMKVHDRATDHLFRAVAWTYLAPGVAIGAVLFAIFGLAIVAVLLGFATVVLR